MIPVSTVSNGDWYRREDVDEPEVDLDRKKVYQDKVLTAVLNMQGIIDKQIYDYHRVLNEHIKRLCILYKVDPIKAHERISVTASVGMVNDPIIVKIYIDNKIVYSYHIYV